MDRRRVEEKIFQLLMGASVLLVAGCMLGILVVVVWRGLPGLNWAMITDIPHGGFYLGKEGGILNAILGSVYLATGATFAALVLSLPVVFYLQREFSGQSRLADIVRLALDVLWGIPSIIFGAFGFGVMLFMGLRASLLGGIIALTLVELPIMARSMDEVLKMVPQALKEASYALGGNRLETTVRVVIRQTLPGLITAILLAFGRGIGDAASVLFTSGYTDRLPTSLFEPAASLPLAVFFQLGTPFPEVQERAYAAGAILLFIVLLVSLISRLLAKKFRRHTIL